MSFRIISFYCDNRKRLIPPHPLEVAKDIHIDLIPMFANSVRHSNPHAELEVLSDFETIFDPTLFDTLHRGRIAHEHIMLERLRQQIKVLTKANLGEKIVFLDTDILVLDDIENVFDGTFDIAVTINEKTNSRKNGDNLYNNGVLFADIRNPGRALNYFQTLHRKLEMLDPSLRAWSGNEHIVRDLLGLRYPGEIVTLEGIRVKILPSSSFNYTPELSDENLCSKKILHFCGNAKPLMHSYALRFGWNFSSIHATT